uniref:Uncharacterized protein n=1 Tax=Panagrolaimus superbus TaxID=310955 RepID=A0A914YA06_9BILA
MAEADDIEFVKHNIEHKLGNNLTNKKLWQLYIDYLRTVDRNAMLHVYSKYCRYFLEDTKMKEEYQRETEQNDTVFVTWKNPFNFEAVPPVIIGLDDDVKRPIEKSWCHEIESFKRFKPLECPRIDFNIAIQDWLLPSPIIRYIIDFANPTVYQKLQQSCKYFFFKKPIHYCYRFLFTDFNVQYVQFVETSAECSSSSISTFNHKSLYITTVLNFYDRMSETSLSEVIRDKIYQCDARYIHICDQKISEKEFKFMVGHGNVEKIELWNCEIKKIDEAVMMMEEILGMLPNIRSIILQNHMLLANNTLSKLQFLNKILKFYISFQSNLDPNDFCAFIKTNAAPYSKFEVSFHSTFDEAIATNIVEAVETLKKQWKPVDEVPFIFVDKSQLL